MQPKVQYKEPPLLFRNLGKGKFENVSRGASAPRSAGRIVARGAAYADYDHDGDLDVLITTNHGPAYLFRNDGGNRNNWICVRTRGVEVEPRRHRRGRAGAERLGQAVEHGAQRVELLLAERSGADVRPRR